MRVQHHQRRWPDLTRYLRESSMEAAWRAVLGKLAVAGGDDFERTALHYLRIIWPAMIQAPRLQKLDRFGVDLCVTNPARDQHLAVSVQAKGLRIDEQLLESQVLNQILPSIEKFRKSPLTCDHYVLLHNRDGSDRAMARLIQAALDQLVRDGKAHCAHLWDRNAFVKELRNHIDRRIRAKLVDRSDALLRRQQRLFHFGDLFVSHVPLHQFRWRPQAPFQHDDFERTSYVNADAAKLIASPRKVRYGLLMGSFGTGKTTTALRAANAKELQVIYVPAHTIHREHGSQGTNYLLRNLNEELDLLEDLPADTAEFLEPLLGAALARVLKQPDNQFVLVIDGLDEHRFYGTPYGLQWLTNELAELQAPIVLTTRREHFLALFGNYELAMGDLSKRGGADRSIDVIQLGPWTLVQATELLERAIDRTQNPDQVARMNELLRRLTSEHHETPAPSILLGHPLFLQMTLDLIVDGEKELAENDDQLIELWLRRKIGRDLIVPRLDSSIPFSVENYTDRMLSAMGQIALQMQSNSEKSQAPAEFIDVDSAVSIVRKNIDLPNMDFPTILATSLLVPTRRKRSRVLEITFFHKALQDFFLRRAAKFSSMTTPD
jgi:hypothetical protein